MMSKSENEEDGKNASKSGSSSSSMESEAQRQLYKERARSQNAQKEESAAKSSKLDRKGKIGDAKNFSEVVEEIISRKMDELGKEQVDRLVGEEARRKLSRKEEAYLKYVRQNDINSFM